MPILESVLERCDFGVDGFDCFREGSGQRVQLWGALPPDWAANLALHCFASGLDIASGDAVRLSESRWAASFSMRSSDPAVRGLQCDFLMMARREPRVLPTLPEPEIRIEMDCSGAGAGGVVAHVRGKDSVGLLAEVLRRFRAFDLAPRHFSLRCADGEVRDRFWLEPIPASQRAAQALDRLPHAMLCGE